MPKLKTHKGAARRFRVTGNGKFVRMKGMRNNKRRIKAYRAKKLFDSKLVVDDTAVRRLKKLLPYG